MGFLGWRFPPRRFNAVLCIARQFIAGVTGFHPPLQPSAPKLPDPAFQRWVMFNPAIHCRGCGIPPLSGVSTPDIGTETAANNVKSEKISPARLVFDGKWVTCGSKRVKKVSRRVAECLRRRRKELSAWQNACDAVAKNFPSGRTLATPSQRTFRAAERLRRRRKELSERNENFLI